MAWREGEKIGPYTILNQLGQGGMATVYKAHHPDLNRYVAIKVMHQTFLEDPTFLARFQREAQIVAGLEHPNIVPIYDFQQHAGLPYLVMKLIEGQTLKQRISNRALSLEQILDVMTAVGSGLAYAHKKGVLHRDIKPSNIVIANDDTPYVTDFGLARITAAGESTISTDMVLGTPHYISPEQARGVKNLDARADIYSLGVVLYELVVGRVPFTADTPYAIIHDHIFTPLPLPSRVNPEIPVSVEAVLIKALAKDPNERHSSADQLAREFRDAITTSRLTSLNPERSSIAAVSLARLREELASDAQTPPRYAAIPAARIPSGTLSGIANASSFSITQHNPKGARFWLWSGLIIFLVGCSISGLVGVSALDTISQITSSDAFNIAFNEPPPGFADNSTPFYPVETLSLDEAQAHVDEQPGDARAYLSLARAAWAANEDTRAEQAVEDGLAVADEQMRYLLTAADLAKRYEQTQQAILYSLLTFNAASDSQSLFLARQIAGEYLYRIAEDSSLNLQESLALANEEGSIRQGSQARSIALLLAVRHQIFTGRPIVAQQGVENLAGTLSDTPEYQLIAGEYYASVDDREAALEAWESVEQLAEDSPTPAWITEQADFFIRSLEE